jgi:basic membrane lipoprotein Med (substrate-binding protein (PBP1-ABC) superfamily)
VRHQLRRGAVVRRGAVALCVGSLALVAAACGSSSQSSSTSSGTTGAAGTATTSGGSAAKGNIKVRVITATSTTSSSWDAGRFAEYSAAAKQNGWDLKVAETVPYGQADQVFKQWGSEGVNVVFSTDNGFEASFLAAAKKYPKTAWVMMSALSKTDNLPNVAAYTFDWCQYGYVQGSAASLVSKSHKIGDVGPVPILPAQQTLIGQQTGAQATVPGTTVEMKMTGDFTDAQKAQAVTSGLIGNGADTIIGVAQGGVAPQIASRAQSEKALYVGSYIDEQKFAPSAVPTSVVIDLSPYYAQAVDGWENGSFSNKVHVTGVKDGVIKVLPLRLGFENQQGKLDAQVQKVSSGAVKWPAGKCAAG